MISFAPTASPNDSSLLGKSTASATVTPSCVITGAPYSFSIITFCPFGPNVTFTASYSGSPLAKTTLEGLTPYWTPTDKISVYDGKNNVFTNTLSAPAPSAQFKGKLEGKSRTRYLAAYPYSPDLTFSFLGMTVYSFVMPTEQSAVENSYDPAAGFAVSYSLFAVACPVSNPVTPPIMSPDKAFPTD